MATAVRWNSRVYSGGGYHEELHHVRLQRCLPAALGLLIDDILRNTEANGTGPCPITPCYISTRPLRQPTPTSATQRLRALLDTSHGTGFARALGLDRTLLTLYQTSNEGNLTSTIRCTSTLLYDNMFAEFITNVTFVGSSGVTDVRAPAKYLSATVPTAASLGQSQPSRHHWLRFGSTPTQRPARRNVGQHVAVAAISAPNHKFGPPGRHKHPLHRPRHWGHALWVYTPRSCAFHIHFEEKTTVWQNPRAAVLLPRQIDDHGSCDADPTSHRVRLGQKRCASNLGA